MIKKWEKKDCRKKVRNRKRKEKIICKKERKVTRERNGIDLRFLSYYECKIENSTIDIKNVFLIIFFE